MLSGGSESPGLLHEGVSPTRSGRGIANPVSFEPDGLIYRRWHERVGSQELRLKLDSE
jgi:hypothetical protein